jgi:outer membrane beta-barrel protein
MLILLAMLAPATVLAQEQLEEEYHKNIKVYQPKPFLKAGRFELTPFAALSTNPSMVNLYGFGGVAGYNINEALWVGGQFTQFVYTSTATRQHLEDDFGLFPERSETGYDATLRFAWTPLFAKGALFGYLLNHWDAYVFGGGGFARTRLTDFAPGGELGLGLRFFMGSAMALNIELSDFLYMETFPGRGTDENGNPNPDDTLFLQNYVLRCGLTVYFPFTFEYRSER